MIKPHFSFLLAAFIGCLPATVQAQKSKVDGWYILQSGDTAKVGFVVPTLFAWKANTGSLKKGIDMVDENGNVAWLNPEDAKGLGFVHNHEWYELVSVSYEGKRIFLPAEVRGRISLYKYMPNVLLIQKGDEELQRFGPYCRGRLTSLMEDCPDAAASVKDDYISDSDMKIHVMRYNGLCPEGKPVKTDEGQ